MTRKLLLTLAFCLLGPGAASASTTVGMDPAFVDGDVRHGCGATQPCTLLQEKVGDLEQTVDATGVVTELRVRGSGGTAKVRRLTRRSVGEFAAGPASAPVTLSGQDQSARVALPVQAGEYLALELSGGASLAADEASLDADQIFAWHPALAEGQSRVLTLEPFGRLAYQAVIEPDADGDGLGDESQDGCVFCAPAPPPPSDGGGAGGGSGTPSPSTPAPTTPAPPKPRPADPYAQIRKAGPKVTFARTMQRQGRTVTVMVTNPYAFPLSGKVGVRRGKRTTGAKTVSLAAKETKAVRLAAGAGVRRLSLAATLKGPVGRPATSTATVKLGKATRKADAGIDGTYRGAGGADAGWTMVIAGGVVKTFTGGLGLHCTKSGAARQQTFTNAADDPPAQVGSDGSFTWEATSGYGLTKLKFTGRVAAGKVTGNAVVEYRPPVSGADPVSGSPRIEFDFCFAGRDYTLAR